MRIRGKLLALPGLLWLALFFALPLIFMLIISFYQRGVYGQLIAEFTMENYIRFFEPLYLRILFDTLVVSVATTLGTLLLAYPLAYYITRLPRAQQMIWLILIMIPFWINFLIRSYAWVIILRSQGVVNTTLINLGIIDVPLALLYNWGSVMLGMIYTLLPFMVLPLYVSLEKLDVRKLEAAHDLGAKPWQAFWHITLPLTKPGILIGSVLVFVSSLGMFVVPDIMGGAKSMLLGNVIQNQFLSARDWPFGAAISIIMMIMSALLIALYYKAMKWEERLEGTK
ncbi:ABC transporter permease [Desulfuribacillus alkaliarsenatis]|uniref:ABC transporter permease n=1 Tax=Desulfuribacillus alkaliarsenatis TaxID=766136 RepID=A0A1E5G3D0_9FIRM|nr:ABC transporter permease [Desulfuribacillus alkaliarsenatis]